MVPRKTLLSVQIRAIDININTKITQLAKLSTRYQLNNTSIYELTADDVFHTWYLVPGTLEVIL